MNASDLRAAEIQRDAVRLLVRQGSQQTLPAVKIDVCVGSMNRETPMRTLFPVVIR